METTITIFENFATKDKPYHITIKDALERIKSQKSLTKILAIRAEEDKTRKKKLKLQLPCIMFNGKFSIRHEDFMLSHSGFTILDWDKLNNAEQFKNDLKIYPFIYSAFISPSGDGVKALVRIPPSIERHAGHYQALLDKFQTDPTGRNLARICYDTCDPDLWINENAVEFTEYVEIEKKKKADPSKIKTTIFTNYAKANIPVNMIRNSIDGQKHETLLRASRLMGGLISAGHVEENEGIRLLEQEILQKDIDDPKGAKNTIRDGILNGKQHPVSDDEVRLLQNEQKTIKSNIEKADLEALSFLADKDEIDNYLSEWRAGTFKKGLSTGIPSLDTHFVFKRGNFNVFNGFDNVGKSTTLWYLTLLSSLFHGWKWLIYTSENKSGTFFKKAMEFYWGKGLQSMNDIEYRTAYAFVSSRFKIIANERMYNFHDILNMTTQVKEKHGIDGVLIDPYNSLKIDLSDNSKLSTHEYHYEAASEMQLFAKKNDTCVYLNCHVVTGAMRLKTPPMKADTEGGGKFANKADDFITIHRETQSPDTWRETQLHIRKIKEIETGGSYTPLDAPYVLTMNSNLCGFSDSSGFNPIIQYHKQNGSQYKLEDNSFKMDELQPSYIKPNIEFNPISTPRALREEKFPDPDF
jgi:hypothetical protein